MRNESRFADHLLSNPTIYHGTPLTPRAALSAMAGRSFCVSFYRPDDVAVCEQIAAGMMYDNGAFSFWKQAMKAGAEWDETERDWQLYYDWIDARVWELGRWAVIPDRPGAPSQLNDALLNEWPHGTEKGSPLWHMDGPIGRLGKLCEKYDRVCLGWIGDPKKEPVGCDAYRRRMDEVAELFGNQWPQIHMMRGVAVARDYPFRQRRQHVARAERVALRQADRRLARLRMGWAHWLRRSIGGQA